MEYKAIAFDVDGTLYSYEEGNKGIMDHTYEMLEKLKNKGYYLILCTGRPFGGVPKKLLNYFDYFVLNNGALVCNVDGHVLNEMPIQHKLVLNLIDFCKNLKRGLILKTWNNSYYYLHEEKVPEYLLEDNEANIQIGLFDIHNEERVYSMVFDLFNEEVYEIRNKYPDLNFAHGGFDYYEIYRKGADKVDGLNFILKKLGISLDDCIAFGDSMNDEQMLLSVGLGVAINTGHPKLLEVVNNNCNSTTKRGIYNFLIENKIL